MRITEVTNVPCARYEGGENDDRVSAVFAFALGLIGKPEILGEIQKYVARVYDYKGDLVVATRQPLPSSWQLAFSRAWVEVGYELEENVFFNPVTSDDWNNYWSGRRFDSDWKP